MLFKTTENIIHIKNTWYKNFNSLHKHSCQLKNFYIWCTNTPENKQDRNFEETRN
jgi:hypothetical protein